jgi:hypothetical protein
MSSIAIEFHKDHFRWSAKAPRPLLQRGPAVEQA